MTEFDDLFEPNQFEPLECFNRNGVHNVFYKGKAPKVKETPEESALADVARSKWDHYQQTFRPLEDTYMNEVNNQDKQGAYDYAKGVSGSATSAAFSGANANMNSSFQARNIDPSSGAYQGAASTVANTQGASGSQAMASAQTNQQNDYIRGLSNIQAMGQGEATQAQQGLSGLAQSSVNRATSDARNSWNNKAAVNSAVGSVVGAGAYQMTNSGGSAPSNSGVENTVAPWVDVNEQQFA